MILSKLAALAVMAAIFVNLCDVHGEARTCYSGPAPEPDPGEHWMQAAVRKIRTRCPGKQKIHKDEKSQGLMGVCREGAPLGMEDRRIPDSSITASSKYGNRNANGPWRARLNIQGFVAGWVSERSDTSPWIQVDFNGEVSMTGLITQGRGERYNQYVNAYNVAYSQDAADWHYVVSAEGTPIQFQGNTDMNTPVNATFPSVIRVNLCDVHGEARTCYFGPALEPDPGEHWMQAAVRKIRTRCPGKQKDEKSQRLMGVCREGAPLGMEDRRIPDSSITASSKYGNRNANGPWRARLNIQGFVAGWLNDKSDTSPWIQVDFKEEVSMTGLITQGRGDKNSEYVKTYNVAYSQDAADWDYVVSAEGTPIQFQGNPTGGNDTPVRATFPSVIRGRYLRILPIDCGFLCGLRYEVLGCSNEQ